jgi:hypothetical protein
VPWFKVDDGFANSEPVMRVPRRYRAIAIGLWTLSGTWCAKELTDGRLPAHMIEELAGTAAIAGHLVACGLWRKTPSGYEFIGWEKYQPTRAEVEEARRKEAERKRKYRESHRDTTGTGAGHDAGHQRVSGHPDPTRPDPTINATADAVARGTRIPEPFIVTAEMRKWASAHAASADVDRETIKFVNYWRAKTRDATKKDWNGTWQNWLMNSHDRTPAKKDTPEQRARRTMTLATDLDVKGIES